MDKGKQMLKKRDADDNNWKKSEIQAKEPLIKQR